MDAKRLFTMAAERLETGEAQTPYQYIRTPRGPAPDKFARASKEVVAFLNCAAVCGYIESYTPRDLPPTDVVRHATMFRINGARHAERYASLEKPYHDFSLFLCHNDWDQIKLILFAEHEAQAQAVSQFCAKRMGRDTPFLSIATLPHIDTIRGLKALEKIAGGLMLSKTVFDGIADGNFSMTEEAPRPVL